MKNVDMEYALDERNLKELIEMLENNHQYFRVIQVKMMAQHIRDLEEQNSNLKQVIARKGKND